MSGEAATAEEREAAAKNLRKYVENLDPAKLIAFAHQNECFMDVYNVEHSGPFIVLLAETSIGHSIHKFSKESWPTTKKSIIDTLMQRLANVIENSPIGPLGLFEHISFPNYSKMTNSLSKYPDSTTGSRVCTDGERVNLSELELQRLQGESPEAEHKSNGEKNSKRASDADSSNRPCSSKDVLEENSLDHADEQTKVQPMPVPIKQSNEVKQEVEETSEHRSEASPVRRSKGSAAFVDKRKVLDRKDSDEREGSMPALSPMQSRSEEAHAREAEEDDDEEKMMGNGRTPRRSERPFKKRAPGSPLRSGRKGKKARRYSPDSDYSGTSAERATGSGSPSSYRLHDEQTPKLEQSDSPAHTSSNGRKGGPPKASSAEAPGDTSNNNGTSSDSTKRNPPIPVVRIRRGRPRRSGDGEDSDEYSIEPRKQRSAPRSPPPPNGAPSRPVLERFHGNGANVASTSSTPPHKVKAERASASNERSSSYNLIRHSISGEYPPELNEEGRPRRTHRKSFRLKSSGESEGEYGSDKRRNSVDAPVEPKLEEDDTKVFHLDGGSSPPKNNIKFVTKIRLNGKGRPGHNERKAAAINGTAKNGLESSVRERLSNEDNYMTIDGCRIRSWFSENARSRPSARDRIVPQEREPLSAAERRKLVDEATLFDDRYRFCFGETDTAETDSDGEARKWDRYTEKEQKWKTERRKRCDVSNDVVKLFKNLEDAEEYEARLAFEAENLADEYKLFSEWYNGLWNGDEVRDWAKRCDNRVTKREKILHMSGRGVSIADNVLSLQCDILEEHNHKDLHLGDIAWAKFGNAYWPGFVRNILPAGYIGKKCDVVVIAWLSEGDQVSPLPYADVYHFDFYFKAMYKPDKQDSTYQRSVARAITILGRVGYWERLIIQKCYNFLLADGMNMSGFPKDIKEEMESNKKVVRKPLAKGEAEKMIATVDKQTIRHFELRHRTLYSGRNSNKCQVNMTELNNFLAVPIGIRKKHLTMWNVPYYMQHKDHLRMGILGPEYAEYIGVPRRPQERPTGYDRYRERCPRDPDLPPLHGPLFEGGEEQRRLINGMDPMISTSADDEDSHEKIDVDMAEVMRNVKEQLKKEEELPQPSPASEPQGMSYIEFMVLDWKSKGLGSAKRLSNEKKTLPGPSNDGSIVLTEFSLRDLTDSESTFYEFNTTTKVAREHLETAEIERIQREKYINQRNLKEKDTRINNRVDDELTKEKIKKDREQRHTNRKK